MIRIIAAPVAISMLLTNRFRGDSGCLRFGRAKFWRSLGRSLGACFAGTFGAKKTSAKTSAQNSQGSAQQKLHDEVLQGDHRQALDFNCTISIGM